MNLDLIADNLDPNLNKNEVFSDDFAKNAYYQYASVLPNLSIKEMPMLFKNSYGSYLDGILTGSTDTVIGYKDSFSHLWNNGISLEQVTSAISESASKAWDFTTNPAYREELINNKKHEYN